MGQSLHAHFPAIGRVLGITASALYGLQVAYLRAGLLDVVKGHGPGSGVRASGKTLAQFLIALATNASIKQNVADAKGVAKTRAVDETGERPCPLTHASTFVDALAAILANLALAECVNEVVIDTSLRQVFVRYDRPNPPPPPPAVQNVGPSSVFGAHAPPAAGIRFQASIPGEVLVALAKVLK
jgi:hypothetical protein